MKIQKSVVSLILVFGLLFCLAFACNDGDTSETGSRGDGKSNKRTSRDNTREPARDGAESEDDAETADADGGDTDAGGSTNSGLPAGTYACFTTVAIYAGQGGGGSAPSYPIYNYSRQTRGSIDVKSDGTYSVGGSRCHYSFDPATKSIQWKDCAFAKASSSQLTADDKGNQVIQVKFSNDKDVWDCAK